MNRRFFRLLLNCPEALFAFSLNRYYKKKSFLLIVNFEVTKTKDQSEKIKGNLNFQIIIIITMKVSPFSSFDNIY